MFCSNCGNQIGENDSFCAKCGARVMRSTYRQQENRQTYGQAYRQPQGYGQTYNQPNRQQMPYPYPRKKESFIVRLIPVLLIITLTIGFIMGSVIFDDSSMLVGMIVSCLPGIILLLLIYTMDRIEHEPVSLLIKLFFGGGIIAVIIAALIELVLDFALGVFFEGGTLIHSFLEAFVVAALTEELCKYMVLKGFTWRHPAFNYRFDGVVYSTTVAIGFEIVENLVYLIDSTAGTAFARAAFPGHCIFGIYMGYFYGQAKAMEVYGDFRRSAALRKKGVLIAVLIHGMYDFICFLASDMESDAVAVLLWLILNILMIVLNVIAYKDIKKYARNDNLV